MGDAKRYCEDHSPEGVVSTCALSVCYLSGLNSLSYLPRTDRLPSVVPQLHNVTLKNPIEQVMMGQGGLFRQSNFEKPKTLSVREWAELCARDELRAPGVDEVGLHARANNAGARLSHCGIKH